MSNPGDGGFTVNTTELKTAQGKLINASDYWQTIQTVIINQAPLPPEAFGVAGVIKGTQQKYHDATMYLETMAGNATGSLTAAAAALWNVINNYVQTDNSNANNLANIPVNPNS